MPKVKPKRSKRAPTLAKLKARAWALLSQIVRQDAARKAQDYGRANCYTCGQSAHWKELQASHAIPGRTGAVLFDEEIIRPCCYRCNVALRGNYPVFTTKLIREQQELFGNDDQGLGFAMEWWEQKLAASRQIRKWSRGELQELIESYKARLVGGP